MNFQVGEVVQLNSGGPAMTVSFIGENEFPHGQKVPVVHCTWFEGKKLNQVKFAPEILRKVKKTD